MDLKSSFFFHKNTLKEIQMKKINKHIPFIIIFILLIFTSCDNEQSKSNNDIIQLWYYEHPSSSDQIIGDVLVAAEDYCDKNNLSLEIVKFNNDTLSYKDYVFKRNLASENGNMIIFDTISELSDLAKRHADYNKIEIYDNLLSAYKNRFCIPIGRRLKTSFFDNNILEYYQIDNSEKPVITYTDFLQLKQDMKKKGARFEPKNEDLYETVKYYLNINGLLYINRQDEILKDNDKLKEALKKTLLEICEDIIIYNNSSLEEFYKSFGWSSFGFELYDTNSKLYLKKIENEIGLYNSPIYIGWFEDARIKGFSNKTFIIDYFGVDYSNFGKTYSLFMDKKITNEKIYDLMNYILEQTSSLFSKYNHKPPLFTPIFIQMM
jgi:hypothetical protein